MDDLDEKIVYHPVVQGPRTTQQTIVKNKGLSQSSEDHHLDFTVRLDPSLRPASLPDPRHTQQPFFFLPSKLQAQDDSHDDFGLNHDTRPESEELKFSEGQGKPKKAA